MRSNGGESQELRFPYRERLLGLFCFALVASRIIPLSPGVYRQAMPSFGIVVAPLIGLLLLALLVPARGGRRGIAVWCFSGLVVGGVFQLVMY